MATAIANTTLSDGYPTFLDAVEEMDRADLDRLQEAATLRMVGYAYATSPLIRQTWDAAGVTPAAIRSMADFINKAPFINKDMVRAYRDAHVDPTGGLVDLNRRDVFAVHTTSGTTGDPTPLTAGWRVPADITYARDAWSIGLRPGDYYVHMMFTFRGAHRRRIFSELGIGDIMFNMSPAEMPRLCEASRRFRPTVMGHFGAPLLMALEQHFERSGDDPTDVFRSYKGAIFGGEPLGQRMKQLTASWGLELFETTALGDSAGATECRAHDGFHADEDIAFIECVDPVTLEPVRDGEVGELVVTNLLDRLSPLVRFRTDDLATITRARCLCGKTHARFKVLGRATDQILVKGRSILPREVMAHVELHRETRAGLFQIVRPARDLDRLRLRVGYDPERLDGSEAALSRRLCEALEAALGVVVQIELVLEAELLKLGPPHKIPRVTKQ